MKSCSRIEECTKFREHEGFMLSYTERGKRYLISYRTYSLMQEEEKVAKML